MKNTELPYAIALLKDLSENEIFPIFYKWGFEANTTPARFFGLRNDLTGGLWDFIHKNHAVDHRYIDFGIHSFLKTSITVDYVRVPGNAPLPLFFQRRGWDYTDAAAGSFDGFRTRNKKMSLQRKWIPFKQSPYFILTTSSDKEEQRKHAEKLIRDIKERLPVIERYFVE